ncbi:DUF2975 domain-containing protein [Ichthyenterobacterium sp. W332]|uniref:DUF2975 domain-containing protein n=1 Tax=Microcosmobacter mediterraneus TaxID=3075607 RepID=A0ABU2YJ60_9FLAO|nr:DUF2975 domain-containing protein [Ichthyenterobacterium sp. W332]MDT0557921.1 DUF2975 domain-containing protein [Ichthyenterobacterium sp. W332]
MKTKQIFSIMNGFSWIVFIGYCIKAGAITLVSIISLFKNKNATENLYMGIDLASIYEFSIFHFVLTTLILILIASLKAYLFYLLIIIFKRIDLHKPFQIDVTHLVFKISYVALTIGILGAVAKPYTIWLRTNVFFTQLDIGTSAYIFMAGVVFIVATLFKRAVEIKQENDLTI